MRAGTLRHKIELHAKTSTQGSFGELSDSWSRYAYAFAAIKPLKGIEAEHAKQVHAEAEIQITMRYNASVTETDRIIFGTRTFEINAVINNDERNRSLTILAKELRD
jgi:SPP1 family predicted phage head-tail adaptor